MPRPLWSLAYVLEKIPSALSEGGLLVLARR
jgi:hypothetical protein